MAFRNNILLQKLGIKFPIIQAPMAGGATTPELVAAVSNYGGLGSLAAGYMESQEIRTAIRKIRELTDKPFAVNLFIPENYSINKRQITKMQNILNIIGKNLLVASMDCEEPYAPDFKQQLSVIIEEQVPIFSFTFGIPDKEEIAWLKKHKITLMGTATNLAEGLALENAGIDIIVAQGSEAGGHRGTFLHNNNGSDIVGLMILIPQMVNNIKLPIIAAGGIMNKFGIDAAINLGASGVALGTAFLTTYESGIHPQYKETLLNTKFDNTMFTRAFSGKTARGIKNQFITQMENYLAEILPYPVQNKLTQALRKKAAATNNIEFMSMWAGQSAYLCRSISAYDLMQELLK